MSGLGFFLHISKEGTRGGVLLSGFETVAKTFGGTRFVEKFLGPPFLLLQLSLSLFVCLRDRGARAYDFVGALLLLPFQRIVKEFLSVPTSLLLAGKQLVGAGNAQLVEA